MLLFVSRALQVSLALLDQRQTQLFALLDSIVWEIAGPSHVMQEFTAQQELNSLRTTTPSALRECTALRALHLFAALRVLSHL